MMETRRELTFEEQARLRRVNRITREDMDALIACLPLDCEWGDPITPEIVQHIIDAAERAATQRAVAAGHGYQVGDRIEHRGDMGTIRVIRPPQRDGYPCSFLLEMDDAKKQAFGSASFWVSGNDSFARLNA